MNNSDFIQFTLQLADRLGIDIVGIRAQIGNMLGLNTNHKTTLVGAINEVDSKVGVLGGLRLESDQANSRLLLKDGSGNVLSNLDVAYLNNEGTTFNLNSATGRIELLNDQGQVLSSADLQSFIKNMIVNASFHNVNKYQLEFFTSDGSTAFTVPFKIENIQGLQAALDNLNAAIGNLPSLTTTHKTTIVGAINEVNGKATDIKIGGRNLAIYSTGLEAIQLYGVTGDYEVVNDATLPSKKFFRLSNITRTVGNLVFYIPFGNRPDLYGYNLSGLPLTISFYIRTNNTQFFTATNVNLNSTFKRIEFQYTWWGSGNLHFDLVGAGLSFVEIHSLKIEIGAKATDWTPSIEEQIPDFNQTDNTQFGYIKNKPLSYPPSQHNHQISEVTGLQGYLDGKVDNLGHVAGVGFNAGLDVNPFVKNTTTGSNVTLATRDWIDAIFAYKNGANTTGGSWAIDYIFSPVLQGAIGNGQVINPLANGTIEYGSDVLNQHRFRVNSIYGMVVVVPGRGAGVVWNEFNYDPNSKVDVMENATGVGFSYGNSNDVPYFYHRTDGYVFLATEAMLNTKASTSYVNSLVGNFFEKESTLWSININHHDLGLFTVLPSTLNLPEQAYGIVYCYKASSTWWFQQFKTTGGVIWERRAINPTNVDDWQPWIKVNANSSIDNYAPITYVDAKVAAIPTHNGQLTVNTTADLVGGYVYLPSGNVTTTLGLATHVLNAIADGQTAYSYGNHATQGYLKIADLAPYETTISVNNKLTAKQDKLIAGANVYIVGNTISATDTDTVTRIGVWGGNYTSGDINFTATGAATIVKNGNNINIDVSTSGGIPNQGVEVLDFTPGSYSIDTNLSTTIVRCTAGGSMYSFDVKKGKYDGDHLYFTSCGYEYQAHGDILSACSNGLIGGSSSAHFIWSDQLTIWVQVV